MLSDNEVKSYLSIVTPSQEEIERHKQEYEHCDYDMLFSSFGFKFIDLENGILNTAGRKLEWYALYLDGYLTEFRIHGPCLQDKDSTFVCSTSDNKGTHRGIAPPYWVRIFNINTGKEWVDHRVLNQQPNRHYVYSFVSEYKKHYYRFKSGW